MLKVREVFRVFVFGLVCLSGAESARGADEQATSRPFNIVLIMAEDLSPRIGVYGDAVAHTPNIDRLSREGTRFTRAFTSAGVCSPSRSAIIMGAHQNSWGAGHMRQSMASGEIESYTAVPPPSWKAFPELLRRAGYYTVNSGKTDYQLDTGLSGVLRGGPFTIWDEASADDWRGRAEDQPFFAYLTIGETHESQVWPTYTLGGLTDLFMTPQRILNHWSWPVATDPDDIVVPPYYPDTQIVRADLVRHYNNIAHMDRIVGEILSLLEADGEADRTVVIFTTDHGDGLPRAKRWVYDSGIRVPLIIRWPGVTSPNSVDEELVSLVDLAPTILSISGAPIPEHLHGRILLGPDEQPEPPYIYAARDRIDESPDTVRAVRDRRYKYIRNLVPEQPYVLPVDFRDRMPMMQEMSRLAAEGELEAGPALWFRSIRDPEELYDTATDPHEIDNLAADPDQVVRLATMRAALDDWLAGSADLGLLPESVQRERFWPGGVRPKTAEPALDVGEGVVHASSDTEGASIGVRVGGGEWVVYTGPLQDVSGKRVDAKAVRYGWLESDVATIRVP